MRTRSVGAQYKAISPDVHVWLTGGGNTKGTLCGTNEHSRWKMFLFWEEHRFFGQYYLETANIELILSNARSRRMEDHIQGQKKEASPNGCGTYFARLE